MPIYFHDDGPTDTHLRLEPWHAQLEMLRPDGYDGDFELSPAYQVHYLSTRDLADGLLLETDHTIRWRHLITGNEQPLAELEVDDNEPFALHNGPASSGLTEAVAIADSFDGNNRAHVVVANGVHFTALWTQNDENDEQIVVPYGPNHTPLADLEPVDPEQVRETLQSLARDIIEQSAESDKTGG